MGMFDYIKLETHIKGFPASFKATSWQVKDLLHLKPDGDHLEFYEYRVRDGELVRLDNGNAVPVAHTGTVYGVGAPKLKGQRSDLARGPLWEIVLSFDNGRLTNAQKRRYS